MEPCYLWPSVGWPYKLVVFLKCRNMGIFACFCGSNRPEVIDFDEFKASSSQKKWTSLSFFWMTHAGFPVWLVWQHVVFRWGKCTPALTDFNSVEDCVEVFRSDCQELVQRIDEKFASLRAQTALPGQQGSWWTLNNIAIYYVIWGCMWHTHTRMISARSWSFWSCPGFDNFCASSPRLRTRSRATCPKLPHVIAYFHTICSRSRRLFLSKIVLVDCLSSTSSQNTKKLGGWGIECNWAWWGARGGKTSHTHML